MTVSPTVATRPPSTDGSTTTFRFTCLPVALASAAARRVSWSAVSGDRGADLGDLEVLGRRGPGDELVDDGRQVAAAAGADDHRDQLRGGAGGLAAEQVLDDRLALAGGDLLVGERVAQRVAALVAAGEAEQLVLDLVERAFGAGDLEQASCVAFDAVESLMRWLLTPTPAMKFSISSCCVASSSEPVTTWSTAALDRRAISARSSSPTATLRGDDVGSGTGLEVGELLASSRARPSSSMAAACASASASMRARSAAMSPLAVRICAASAAAAARSASPASSSSGSSRCGRPSPS